jgi:Mrp family chromosome partitioning ATPase
MADAVAGSDSTRREEPSAEVAGENLAASTAAAEQPVSAAGLHGASQVPAQVPAWLSDQERARRAAEAVQESPVEDTLQQSRERVASRWFALRELFEEGTQDHAPEVQKAASGEVPVLAVFSLAGGVGKTSLVATL